MRAVIQRVTKAHVSVEDKVTGSIGKGLMVLIGVAGDDEENDVAYMADKIVNLRIFEDEEGKMNRSVAEIGGSVLAVSQFTLFGDVRKGRRPSFIEAARPEKARELYQKLVDAIKNQDICVEEGVFQAEMLVSLDNDGPVTILLDSRKQF